MTSRAAILPYPGDPFLLNYWLNNYQKYWEKEIDKLYIHFNSPIEKPVAEYIMDRISRTGNIVCKYKNGHTQHGDAINEMLSLVTEKYIMLVEDDGFIFKSGFVDQCFKFIEDGQYDLVGSKRGSCAMEILIRAKELWDLDYEGPGDQGPNFWPNFLFTTAETLKTKTDRDFNSRAWVRGQVIPELANYIVKDELIASDTFVHASLQLRSTVPKTRILCLPQYHGHPDDLDFYRAKVGLFSGAAPWCHIGSLSSGASGILTDNQGRSLSKRLNEAPHPTDELPKYCNTDFEKREFERRVQWWLTFWEKREPGKIDEFAVLYKNAIERIIQQYRLSIKQIRLRQIAYATLGL